MSPKKRVKKAKTKASVGLLRVQPKGRGALAVGGPPPPTSMVRDRASRYFEDHIETLNDIANGALEGATPTVTERINAIKALGTFGIGVKIESTVDERRVLVIKVVYEGKAVAE